MHVDRSDYHVNIVNNVYFYFYNLFDNYKGDYLNHFTSRLPFQ